MNGGAEFRAVSRTKDEIAMDRSELLGIRRSRGVASVELMNLYVPLYLERHLGKSWEQLRAEQEAQK